MRATGTEESYHSEFMKSIDVAISFLDKYFDSQDLDTYASLTKMLLSGNVDPEIVKIYPERK